MNISKSKTLKAALYGVFFIGGVNTLQAQWTLGGIGGTQAVLTGTSVQGSSTGGSLTIANANGNLVIGPQNGLWCHMVTDRSQYYFNKPLFLDGGTLSSYGPGNLFLQTGTSNFNSGTTRMTVLNSNGYVGINTSLPGSMLDVNGNIQLEGTHLIYNSPEAVIDWGSAGSGSLHFRTLYTQGNVGTPTERMVLANNGFLGLNTTPQLPLDVNGAGSSGQIAIFRNGPYTTQIVAGGGAGGYNYLAQAGDNGLIWANGSSNTNGFVLAPWQNSTIGIRIDGTSGNLTAARGYLSMGCASNQNLQFGTAFIGFNASRSSSTVNSTGTWTCATDGAHNGATAIYGDINGNLRFLSFPNTSAPTTNSVLDDVHAYNSTTMTLSSSGQLIIGSPALNMTTPGPYKLYVAGGILTEQIQVSIMNTSGWADYVFADKYQLKPLSELEQYVKNNKHLPEVPSAEEVKKDGINIAEMDATLLKKIEELTLYVIEQNKKIELLEKQVNKK